MNCSSCEFAAKIKDAELGGFRYEDTPCASCKLTENSSHTMEYDDERHSPETENPADSEDMGGTLMPVSVLGDALREILTLPPDTLRVLQARYLGRPYAEIGRETGTTAQAAEIKIRRLLDQHEYLRHLLPAKAKRQEARKRKMRSMARRGKPGVGAKVEGG